MPTDRSYPRRIPGESGAAYRKSALAERSALKLRADALKKLQRPRTPLSGAKRTPPNAR